MRFIQTKKVDWLDTPENTIWKMTEGEYIQPEDYNLRTTPLGVKLDLVYDETLFEEANIINENL